MISIYFYSKNKIENMNGSFKVSQQGYKLPPVIEIKSLIVSGNTPTPPIPNTNGGILYSNGGVLIYRGAEGSVTIIANS